MRPTRRPAFFERGVPVPLCAGRSQSLQHVNGTPIESDGGPPYSKSANGHAEPQGPALTRFRQRYHFEKPVMGIFRNGREFRLRFAKVLVKSRATRFWSRGLHTRKEIRSWRSAKWGTGQTVPGLVPLIESGRFGSTDRYRSEPAVRAHRSLARPRVARETVHVARNG